MLNSKLVSSESRGGEGAKGCVARRLAMHSMSQISDHPLNTSMLKWICCQTQID